VSESAINEGLGIAVDQVVTALKRNGIDPSSGDYGAAIDALVDRTRREWIPSLRSIADSIGRNASGTGIDHDKRPTEYKEGMLKAYEHCLEIVRHKLAHPDQPVPRTTYLAHITANQAQNLLDYFGGEATTYVLTRCEEGMFAEDGSPSPAGLYIYDLNCPEEGVIYLGDEDEDSKPRDDDADVEYPAEQHPADVFVGGLSTMNQDTYPGLGAWWVQLRTGPTRDEIFARVYGDSPTQARHRARQVRDALGTHPEADHG